MCVCFVMMIVLFSLSHFFEREFDFLQFRVLKKRRAPLKSRTVAHGNKQTPETYTIFSKPKKGLIIETKPNKKSRHNKQKNVDSLKTDDTIY